MFKQNFIRLCNQKGESPSYVCRQVGITPATYSLWTDESVPRRATLQRIADYFQVSTTYLLGLSDDPHVVLSEQVIANAAAGVQRVVDELEKEKEPPMIMKIEEAMKDMTEEQLEDLEKYVEFLLSRKKS